MYDLALISYVLALGHFLSEFALFRTAGVVGVASPFIVASCVSIPSLLLPVLSSLALRTTLMTVFEYERSNEFDLDDPACVFLPPFPLPSPTEPVSSVSQSTTSTSASKPSTFLFRSPRPPILLQVSSIATQLIVSFSRLLPAHFALD